MIPDTFYLPNTTNNLTTEYSHQQNIMRNRNESDFKIEEENCMFHKRVEIT